jgi:tripartite-type tricarboxylate transporter receptor subunit TctC
MIERRRFLGLAAASAILPAFGGGNAFAQVWPNRHVRLVVPFTPGGANDTIARILAPRLSELWGQPVVIENKPGAGANIGIEAVARSLPDGYTVLITPIALAVNRFLYPSLNYDPVADFAPVTLICSEPNIMAVPNTSTARSVSEFVRQTKARPGSMSYASAGRGTSLHLSGEMFKRMAGIELTHVPYRGSAPAIIDLISGRIDVMFGSAGSMLPHVKAGKLRGLAVTTPQRSPVIPELPTIAESGVPGFNVSSWFALFVPAKTPSEIVKTIHAGAVSALNQPQVRERFSELGAVIIGSTPQELAAHLDSEMRKWGSLIKEADIKADS